jgi:hypothetical protein
MADAHLLRQAAERAAAQRFFLASLLLPYAAAEGLDDAALAGRIGCHRARLAALLLCRRPDPGAGFRPDVQEIARHFGVDAARLAGIIRLAEGVEALRGATERGAQGLMAAARDREKQEGEQ